MSLLSETVVAETASNPAMRRIDMGFDPVNEQCKLG
jgi:hypothetical protein